MNKLPIAKTDNLVIQNLENEIVIYDLTTNKAFCLNETSAIVFQACDGKTDFDQLKSKSNFTHDLIHLTLAELEKQKLIEFETDYVSPLAGMTRREAVRKVGLATMIALPVISSLVAPSAINAASGVCVASGQQCSPTSDFSQADCCDTNQRCFRSAFPLTCGPCVANGNNFATVGGNIGDSGCTSIDLHNRCCNTGGGSTSTYNSGTNVTTCRCA
ncbi:MAG TPA: PqqD family protein [Pyrinomonadaceae bacterium]|nr:PqqD family protein [Pyrinomonadaceae bacterium]